MTTLLQLREFRRIPLAAPEDLLERVEFFRVDAARRIDAEQRSQLGQFLTPAAVSRLMAQMFVNRPQSLQCLDAGAGVGSLSAALVAQACRWDQPPRELTITAYEIDPILREYLLETLEACAAICRRAGIRFVGEVRAEDFIRAGTGILHGRGLFPGDTVSINAAILNPPYRKINTQSETRRLLSTVGIETSNLYTGFLWLALKLLDPSGELVAITPRSFCNGPYFRPFRKALLSTMKLRRIHVFESRDRAFSDDDVLQENIIFHAVKMPAEAPPVVISSSAGPEDEDVTLRTVPHEQIVRPMDPDACIHIVSDELSEEIGEQMRSLQASLADLHLSVSTGRVVDFRAEEYLRAEPQNDTVPLIYPCHFADGFVEWPNLKARKPNAIVRNRRTEELLISSGHYVLVKRFSAKEERRRIVAAVYDPSRVQAEEVGFENHLNYYHRNGAALDPVLARGLAGFLNSSLVDCYFRQFSGHTQVNAADLRRLKYPSLSSLMGLGSRIGDASPTQEDLDSLIQEELFNMPSNRRRNAVQAKKKMNQALDILKALNVPRAQQNERSALTLLALLDVRPLSPWKDASNPLLGITEMMDYFQEHYGKQYAPNTRETVRRHTVHQFVQMGLVVANPDDPDRPTNSPDNRYQVEREALELLRTFGTSEWDKGLAAYLSSARDLSRLRPQERIMKQVPVKLPDGEKVVLTPGEHNLLIKQIIEEFCPRFTPGGVVVYVGDTRDKYAVQLAGQLSELGVELDRHGKMPDVVVHYPKKNWLVLIEAVTSHGPISLKRHNELKKLFKRAHAGLVFVTAFLTRKAVKEYLTDIAWETDVWVAESPTHLIHFDGERFLGPY